MKNFIREDGSVCHAYRFDEITGEPVEEFNDCGYSVGSHWARGTAWAVYGFALAWRFTGLERYRQAVLKLTGKYLELCAPDGVPVWDFRLPEDKPARHFGSQETWEYWDITDPANRTLNVDSSAAAIMACGMLEFLSKEENESMRQYVQTVARTWHSSIWSWIRNARVCCVSRMEMRPSPVLATILLWSCMPDC